jgi:hypothetical protein
MTDFHDVELMLYEAGDNRTSTPHVLEITRRGASYDVGIGRVHTNRALNTMATSEACRHIEHSR